MNEVICDTKDRSAVEQIEKFLNTLTEQQQREFLLMIQGAQFTMQLMKKECQSEQTA